MKTVFIMALFFCSISISSAQTSIVGNWEGNINVGVNLRAVFHIKDNGGGKLSATFDSPDQNALGIPCSGVEVKADSLFIEVAVAHGGYKGKIIDTANIKGNWTQGGREFTLDLQKTHKVAEAPKRPQTPKPPYDYLSEDVIYKNTDATIQYGATITTPKGAGPFPAVLLITGSGLQDRDETIFGHKPFAVIADYLTKKGYMVMRVDDRTIGQSTGDVLKATTADFAGDVETSFDYLKKYKGVDKKRMGLLGHSEGGAIAEILASRRKDVDFIIMLAGPGVKGTVLLAEQNEAFYLAAGIDSQKVEQYLPFFKNAEYLAVKAKDSAQFRTDFVKLYTAWKAKTPSETVSLFTGSTNEPGAEKKYIDIVVNQFSSPWMVYFLGYDPAPYLEKISCKVLALDGDRDIQVISKTNLKGIHDGLAKSKSKVHDAIELKGLNHLFQTCKKCTVQEYGELEETMAPAALQTIGDWMDKNVK